MKFKMMNYKCLDDLLPVQIMAYDKAIQIFSQGITYQNSNMRDQLAYDFAHRKLFELDKYLNRTGLSDQEKLCEVRLG